VGKSILAANIAVYLAQLGRSVILADLDPGGSRLHTLFGLPPIAAARTDDDVRPVPVATPVPGLFLVAPPREPGARLGGSKRHRWGLDLGQLGSDYVLLDVGVGTTNASVDLFLLADVGVCVVAPEPPAIEATYDFLRTVFFRRVRRALAKDKFKVRILERAVQGVALLPNPPQVIAALGQHDPMLAEQAKLELSRLSPRLVVSQTRVRTDLELGGAMRAMAWRYLGIDLDYLGYIEHDDAVWLTVRRRRPLLIDNPTSKGARNLERIARRVLALVTTPEARSPVAPDLGRFLPLSFYELLGIPRGASDEEVRRATKRQREIYAEGSLPLTSLLSADDFSREQARLEEAYDTLLDPNRRRAYDLSTYSEPMSNQEPSREGRSEAAERELLLLQAEVAREIHAETDFTGALLRKVRESQGVELAEIAGKTKIAIVHLSAIEDESFEDMPAIVYARGFLQELAKTLRLDPAQVTRTYLKRMREILSLSGRTVV
jgi:flagellar biosynthesis protein FlhG